MLASTRASEGAKVTRDQIGGTKDVVVIGGKGKGRFVRSANGWGTTNPGMKENQQEK